MSVPALGLVGAVSALAGGEPVAESEPIGALAPVAGTTVPPVDAAVAEPAVMGVAADAARAAGQAGERQRLQERRSIEAVVDDVRADARERDAAAAAQGRQELEDFRRDVARQQEIRPTTDPGPNPDPNGAGGRCDTAGLPLFGDRAEGDEIVGRHCGLTDLVGRQRSSDPWIDGQLLSSGGE